MKLKHILGLVLAVALLTACEEKKPDFTQPPPSTGSTAPANPDGVLTNQDVVTSMIAKGQETKADIQTSEIARAIEAYKAEEGKLPPSLEELVAKNYLSKMPTVPQGLKLKYDPTTGTISVELERVPQAPAPAQ
ncbi:MAG: hypothetical protein SFY92_12090 [Verrucomicrobiae bacterium]|nr:hypothetical protein [Verrucomicrobiae bacterium]